MDENQITDRPERARPETGIAAGVPASPAPAAPPRRRKMRWWMPVAVVVLLGGAVGFFWWPAADLFDQATRTLAIKAACLAIVLLLALWYIFFTGLWWRTRLLLSGIGLLLIVGFFAALRFSGATGDMGFRYTWRWQAPPDAALAGQSDDIVLQRPLAVTVRPGDFPQFLGPNRDAVVHGVHLDRDWAAHPPREVWRKPVGAGWSAFAVAGPLAVTQEQRGGREMVVARDRETGDVLWQHGNADRFSELMGGDGPRATPTIAGGKVFALGATGVLDCLDASTGKLRWTRDTLRESGEQNLEWGKSCSPLVIDDLGLVVVSLGGGGPGGSLAAYDVNSGERKWVAGSDRASYASPMLTTLSGGRQVVMVNGKTVTGHDPAEGTVLWQYDWGTAPAKASQPPVLNGNNLLLTGGYGLKGVLLQVKREGSSWTTEEMWTTGHMKTKFTTPVVRDHYAYGLDDGVLTCIDLDDDGNRVWQAGRAGQPNHFGHGQVLLVEDLLLVQAESGEVALVEASPKGFHKLGEVPVFTTKTWNNPALAGNRLFLRNDREAACYELATVDKP